MRIRELERLLEDSIYRASNASNPADQIALTKLAARLRIAELNWRRAKLRSKLAPKQNADPGPKHPARNCSPGPPRPQ